MIKLFERFLKLYKGTPDPPPDIHKVLMMKIRESLAENRALLKNLKTRPK